MPKGTDFNKLFDVEGRQDIFTIPIRVPASILGANFLFGLICQAALNVGLYVIYRKQLIFTV